MYEQRSWAIWAKLGAAIAVLSFAACANEDVVIPPHRCVAVGSSENTDSPTARALDVFLANRTHKLSAPQRWSVLKYCTELRSGAHTPARAAEWHEIRKAVADPQHGARELMMLSLEFAIASEMCFPVRDVDERADSSALDNLLGQRELVLSADQKRVLLIACAELRAGELTAAHALDWHEMLRGAADERYSAQDLLRILMDFTLSSSRCSLGARSASAT